MVAPDVVSQSQGLRKYLVRPTQERLVSTSLYRRTHNCSASSMVVFDGQQQLEKAVGEAGYRRLVVCDQMNWREQQPKQTRQVQAMKGGVLLLPEV